jgi:hypothetical protein
MMPVEPEVELSAQALAALEIGLASLPSRIETSELSVNAVVRYVSGVLEPERAVEIERALSNDLRSGNLLAKTYRTIEDFRRLTWHELQTMRPDDELVAQIRLEWIDCAALSLVPADRPNLTLQGLLSLAETGIKGARIAMGIVSQIFDSGLAPRMPAFAAATRSGINGAHLEGQELRDSGVRFEAAIVADDRLLLNIHFPKGVTSPNRTVWIAFEANRQWLCLGFTEIQEGSAFIELPGFGKLLGLSPGQLPPNLFSLRFDEWPSVCKNGALVVQSGPEPFAEIESDPLIDDGNVCIDIRLLPQSLDLKRSNELEMWFGTGGNVWQLLGRWPIPEDLERTLSLKCPSPKPGPIGVAFPGVLKLALRG